MIKYPEISPDLLHIGPLRVRWYGMMYLISFLAGRQILRRLCKKGYLRMAPDAVDDLLIALFIGMLIGARAVYMLVYYRHVPGEPFYWWTPFAVWQGGLAFHGGVIGMLGGIWWFTRKRKIPLLNLGDSVWLAAPIGIMLGRIGNFINAELYGRETNVPWAMSFPVQTTEGTFWTSPRHPSQLYEALGEGLMTLIVAWIVKGRTNTQGVVSAAAIMWYAVARFVIEFFREKDAQLRYYFGWMTMGQILCVLMLAAGIWLLWFSRKRNLPVYTKEEPLPEPAKPAQPE